MDVILLFALFSTATEQERVQGHSMSLLRCPLILMSLLERTFLHGRRDHILFGMLPRAQNEGIRAFCRGEAAQAFEGLRSRKQTDVTKQNKIT